MDHEDELSPLSDDNKMCLWNTNAPETAIFWEM